MRAVKQMMSFTITKLNNNKENHHFTCSSMSSKDKSIAHVLIITTIFKGIYNFFVRQDDGWRKAMRAVKRTMSFTSTKRTNNNKNHHFSCSNMPARYQTILTIVPGLQKGGTMPFQGNLLHHRHGEIHSTFFCDNFYSIFECSVQYWAGSI